MHKIETELLQKSPLQPTFFKRFIDDTYISNLATWRRRITQIPANDKQPPQDNQIHGKNILKRKYLFWTL